MILRLTNEEVELMREALAAYAHSLRDKARPVCAGYSPEGIALCCRRLEAETLASDLLNHQPRLFAVDHIPQAHAPKAHVTTAQPAGVVPFPNCAA